MLAAAPPAPPTAQTDYNVVIPPNTEDWETIRSAAATCRSCPLWKNATQTVFGEGPLTAKLMLVGEQPGDVEDLAGHAFVGPAGLLLNQAMKEAGLERETLYITNTVKHFKWEPRGKRRLHQKPSEKDVACCKPWLEAEIRIVRPKILLCLGATAAKAIVGADVKIQRDRGNPQPTAFAPKTLITSHPSALLRAPDEATRAANYALFVEDLRIVRRLLDEDI